MSTHFSYDCPHCQTRGAGFSTRYQWPRRNNPRCANILAVCGVCDEGCIILSNSLAANPHIDLVRNAVNYSPVKYEILESWPTFVSSTPDGVPENVGKFYLQGMDNLQAQRWDAAGAMFRKTLDTATKRMSDEFKSITLYARINKLVSEGLLTEAMGDWSHEIRLDGNDAVHDEEPEDRG